MSPAEFNLNGGSTAHGYNPDLHGGGWVAAPALVPTPIVWSHGGTHVVVEGSFDNWTSRTEMHRNGAARRRRRN